MNAFMRLRSDRQLLTLMRSGSDEAFAVLHDRYRQRLFLYVRRILNRYPPEDAEDVLQEVFARAYRSLLADERDIPVSAWLYRIARNRCFDHIRGRPEPDLQEDLPARDAFEDLVEREDVRRLVAGIDRLPERQRSALVMREFSGLSYADLADSLNVSVPAVKSLLNRARNGLAASMA